MATLTFDPSGTHVTKRRLKIRLNIYAAPTDKAYAQHYVYVPVVPEDATKEQLEDPAWIAALPHIWRLNPHLCIFVRVGADISEALLQQFVADVFTPGVLATIDDAIIKKGSIHLISPYMRNKLTLSSAKVDTFDKQDKEDLDALLGGFQYNVKTPGISEHLEPQSIDVGPGATDRSAQWISFYTLVEKGNPANATGTLDTFEIWAQSNMTACKMATFIDEGSNNLSTRDYETIGAVVSGSKQTYPGLSCNVATGDYLGVSIDGNLERDSSGGVGVWYSAGDHIPASSYAFTYEANDELSIYATGTETPPAPSTTPSRWIDNNINNDIDNSIDNFVDGGRP